MPIVLCQVEYRLRTKKSAPAKKNRQGRSLFIAIAGRALLYGDRHLYNAANARIAETVVDEADIAAFVRSAIGTGLVRGVK